MATFEQCTDNASTNDSVQHRKYPLIRLEPSIKKFLKVIQIDLARLHRHRLNVEKYNRLQDWSNLHTEQINATRTIQQIKGNIHEIEKSRLQVNDDDLEKFDNRINDMKHGAIKSVNEFVDMAKGSKNDTRNSSLDSSPCDEDNQLFSHNSLDDLDQVQVQLNEPPENTQVAQSWENLRENLEELDAMIHQFASSVQTQQEGVDKIEDNIEQAQTSVREGTKHLAKAAKYKAVVLPIAGALVGTVLGGPVGFVVGAKIGGLVGVGGGVAGFFGGRYIKKRRDKVTEMELSKLSRSNSLPDVHAENGMDTSSLHNGGRKRNQSTAEILDIT